MKKHEFYAQYANLPLDKRMVPLDLIKFKERTANELYKRMKETDDVIRGMEKEQEYLLEIANEYFPLLK
jgi:hypothetical protein